jgi:hypothetical protein
VSEEFVPPQLHSTLRVIFLGVMTDAFYEASQRERTEDILRRFKLLVEEWKGLGARILATLDDDLLMVGQPSDGWTFYLLLEVDDLKTVVAMINRIREPIDGVAMDRYVRFEARIGRPFFLLEESL